MALQALRAAVGDKDFFTALRTWTIQRRGGNGSVTDFLALIERVSGKNVDNIAQTWLFTPTHPRHLPEPELRTQRAAPGAQSHQACPRSTDQLCADDC